MSKWTPERRAEASKQAKERLGKKASLVEPIEKEPVEPTSLNALETTNEVEPIVEPTPELVLGLEDKSKLNFKDKVDTVIRLLKVLPLQYRETEEQLKRNIWNIGRFEPTNEMIKLAQEAIENEPKRTPK